MKKINRGIFSFFKAIFKFLDKWLITPITKLFLKINAIFKGNGKGIEKFLNNNQTLIVLSLIFSLGVFYIIDQNSNTIINQSAEILYNQAVSAEYNEEAYVIEGLPESVDITLIGRSSDIYLAKQYPSNEVSVDLRDLKPGSHTVTLNYKQALSSISYKLDPSTATIMVYEKVSETKELTYDVLHKDSLNSKLVISNIVLDRNDVIIKGAEYKLEQVATVKALIDVENISNQAAGEITLKNIQLVAYDASGSTVDVEIVPQTVTATITIESPSKELPVEIVPTGTLAFGKSISSLTSNTTSIIVYGDQEVLNGMESFPIEIDVDNLEKNKDYNINLKNPTGIRDMSVKTILVKLVLSDSTTTEIPDVSITPINIGAGLKAQALTEQDSKVAVTVTGSKSVIDAIDPTSIFANVDLSGLGEGEYDVDVLVTGNDLKLKYESKVKTVKIKIIKG